MSNNESTRSSRMVVGLLAVMLLCAVVAIGYSVVVAAAWAGVLEGLVILGVVIVVVAGVWTWRSRIRR